MKFDQSERLIKLKGPFGDTEVCAISFSASETISRLPSFSLDFLSLNLKLTGKDIIGKNITVEIQRFDDDGKTIGSRFFNGYVNRLSGGELTTEQTMIYRGYHVEIVPWLWFLTQTSNCHIFFPDKQEKTIKEIIEDVFKRTIHVDPKWEIGDASILSSRKVEHCVQYRETDFNFVSRILEQYGVHYFFKHADGEHTMVLSDKASYPSCEESKVDYMRQTLLIKDNCVTSWEHQFEFITGKFVQTDYNFENAVEDLETNSPKISSEVAPDVTSYEIYDYPGEYKVKSDGDKESRIRQEEEEISHNRVHGGSSCKTFCAGHKFELAKHPDEKLKSLELGEYLITSIHHRANQPYTSGTGAHIKYSNDFTCIPATYAFRPARVTPKPIVSGVQTGVVTGPSGEEIYTDKYGRVKVFFHWDRETREIKTSEGENCSCWIRVAQNMAGRKWGFMAIPRIGQEVVIDFLEGDPDRPLIVGSVYNSDQMPHYDPPEHKTRTYFKTNSTKGGDGFNELMFEDLADEEMVFMHAEKNMDVRVKNNSTETIVGNRYQIIGSDNNSEMVEDGGDQSELVWRDKHLNIKRDQVEKIEGQYRLTVGHGDAGDPGIVDYEFENQWRIKVGDGGLHTTVMGDDNKSVGGSKSVKVTNNLMCQADGSISTEAMEIKTEAGLGYSLKAGTTVDAKAGVSFKMEAGAMLNIKSPMISISSDTFLSLTCGGSFITLTPAGIFISGPAVLINSGGSGMAAEGSFPQAPDPPTAPDAALLAEPMETPPSHNEKTGQKSN